MSLKTIVSGIIAATGSYLALMRLVYDYLPAQFVANWPSPPWEGLIEENWVNIAVLGFTALSLFLGGWLSASWNGARHWRESVRFGTNAGLIAGALNYNFVGAPWAGLVAQREVLEKANIALTEMEGGKILVNAVTNTIQQSYSAIWLFILPAIILGAFGGLFFALDIQPKEKKKEPRKSGWLFRLPAYTLTLSGLVSLIIMYALMLLLPEIIADSAIDFNTVPNIPPHLLLPLTTVIIAPFFIEPFLLTIIWFTRRWKTHKQGRFLFFIWILFPFAFIYFLNNDSLKYLRTLFEIGLASFIFTAFSIIIGIFLLMWFLSTEPNEDKFKFSLSDWIGYALTQGILGGTQLVASSIAFALSVTLITTENIPHLLSVPSDTPPIPPAEQIEALFSIQQKSALSVMGGMFLIALVLGGITAFLRGITGMNKQPTKPQISQEFDFKTDY